jgi:hypothetical protein
MKKNLLALVSIITLLATNLSAENVIYSFNGVSAQITTGNSDGTNGVVLLQGKNTVRAMAVHSGSSKLYWTETSSSKIYRSNLDGTSSEVFIGSGFNAVRDIEIDNSANKIYYVDSFEIKRINTNGTGSETIFTAIEAIGGIGLDVAGGKIYWFEDSGSNPSDALKRSNLDGTSVETLTSFAIFSATDVEVDPTGAKVFVVDNQVSKIVRTNLDGSGVVDFMTGLNGPYGIELDLTNSKILIANGAANQVIQANLSDGSGSTVIINSVNGPADLEVLPASNILYTIDSQRESISRSELDGTSLDEIISGNPTEVRGIDFDYRTGDFYTVQELSNEILRYDADGTNETLIIGGLTTPADIIVNEADNKIYYIEANPDNIRRVNLDGTGNETIINTVNAGGIDIDQQEERLYWAENTSGEVRYSNLDGTGSTLLTTINIAPASPAIQGLAFSDSQQSLFVTESNQNRIYKILLDGSVPTTIINTDNSPRKIKVDEIGEKIYWAETANVIKRANFDGSSVETVLNSADQVFFSTALGLLFDNDEDGTYDPNDNCPLDSDKTSPGLCGCGTADTDTDSDGDPNCTDNCDNDPLKSNPLVCGCGVSEADSDSDGTLNCLETCDTDPDKTAPGTCGCGTPDNDTDSDGTLDCDDDCPSDSAKTTVGVCGCGVVDGTDSNSNEIDDCLGNADVTSQAEKIIRKLNRRRNPRRLFNNLINFIEANSSFIVPETAGYNVLSNVNKARRRALRGRYTGAKIKLSGVIAELS